MQKLFEVAQELCDLAGILQKSRENISNLNRNEVLQELNQYSEGENRTFFIKRKLRGAYKDLFNFLAANGDDKNHHLATALALCCYNLDWEQVFEVLSVNTGNDFYHLSSFNGEKVDFSLGYNVKSWGNVHKNFDTNFLRFIRNGLAHGKFDFDFENNNVIVKMWNDTFVVEMPMHNVFFQPYSLYNLYEKTEYEDKEDKIFILGETEPPYKKAIGLKIKNQTQLADKKVLNRLPKEIRDSIVDLKRQIEEFEKEKDVKLSAKQKLASIGPVLFDALAKKFENLNERMDVFKSIAEYLGVSVQKSKVVDYKKDIYKSNRFVECAVENLRLENGTFESVLESKVTAEGKSFYAYFRLLGAVIEGTSGNEARFIDNIMKSFAFVNMDEVCEFADRAFLNFVCNYLVVKCKISDKWKTVPASEYFVANDFTTNNTVYDIFQAGDNKAYIRNCLVHPGFFKFDGINYRFTDYDKTGNLVFDGLISRENLIRFTTDILDEFKIEHPNHSSEEIV